MKCDLMMRISSQAKLSHFHSFLAFLRITVILKSILSKLSPQKHSSKIKKLTYDTQSDAYEYIPYIHWTSPKRTEDNTKYILFTEFKSWTWLWIFTQIAIQHWCSIQRADLSKILRSFFHVDFYYINWEIGSCARICYENFKIYSQAVDVLWTCLCFVFRLFLHFVSLLRNSWQI